MMPPKKAFARYAASLDRYPRSLAIKQRALETPLCLARRPDRGIIVDLSQSSHRFVVRERFQYHVTRLPSTLRWSPVVPVRGLGYLHAWRDRLTRCVMMLSRLCGLYDSVS